VTEEEKEYGGRGSNIGPLVAGFALETELDKDIGMVALRVM